MDQRSPLAESIVYARRCIDISELKRLGALVVAIHTRIAPPDAVKNQIVFTAQNGRSSSLSIAEFGSTSAGLLLFADVVLLAAPSLLRFESQM